MGHLHVTQGGLQLGVHDEHFGSRVVDDVLDLLCVQPEVDRHAHSPEGTGAEQEHQQPGCVVADHGHPGSEVQAHLVQTGGHGPREFAHSPIGEVRQGGGHLVRLVDEGDPVAVYEFGPTQVVCNGQWDLHGVVPLANRYFGRRPGSVARG